MFSHTVSSHPICIIKQIDNGIMIKVHKTGIIPSEIILNRDHFDFIMIKMCYDIKSKTITMTTDKRE